MTTPGAPTEARTVLMLGRQGSGKGVQAELLAAAFGLEHVSIGEALREGVRRQTDLGVVVEPFLLRGELVPDDVVEAVLADRLGDAWARGSGVVLDGYPRTVLQVERLVDLLSPTRVDVAVRLDVPRSLAIERVLGRRVCPSCGYSGRERSCERCGSMTETRHDDRPEVVGRRMSDDARESGPLLAWLDARGMLVTIDGVGPIATVAARVQTAVAAALDIGASVS